ncbi:hypothetical protein L7F22_001221 [Adiantum nelumboides]|nr:hypothetical protein [Adiantum nelumboides]
MLYYDCNVDLDKLCKVDKKTADKILNQIKHELRYTESKPLLTDDKFTWHFDRELYNTRFGENKDPFAKKENTTAVWMSDALGIVPNCQNSILEWFRAQNRMDGNKEEGSSSEDRQSNPIVHEVGEGSSQAEEGFPHAASVWMSDALGIVPNCQNSILEWFRAQNSYSFATEEDMKRWERSYEKLRPAHKELLPHLPKKYQDLRRCSAANFRFILNMLQAFDSPFDMSQDYDTGEEDTIKQARKFSFGSNSACQNGTCDEIHAHTPFEASDRATNGQLCSPDRNGIASPRERDAQLDGAVQNGQCSGGLCGKDSRCIENRLKGGKARLEDVNKIAKTERSFSKIKKISVCGMNFQDPSLQLHVPPADVDKVRCIIRNIVRDWTKEGALERDQCYKPILEELSYYFPNRSKERPPCCVVPGAGLARLACEISCLGFACQGNEFSYYMLICSSFILNNTQAPLEWVIYPWIHSNCNMTSDENQLQPVYFPDLHPGSAGITDGFSMCAGDFVEVYSHSGQEGTWDAVVTCFFIDTAHNIVEYIEIIAKILKPGGVWINLGPLLYHFADAVSFSGEEEMSLEISLEDVKKVALSYGLKLQKERTIETTYTANQKSMIQTRYTAAFWTMIKDGDMQTAQL